MGGVGGVVGDNEENYSHLSESERCESFPRLVQAPKWPKPPCARDSAMPSGKKILTGELPSAALDVTATSSNHAVGC